MTPDQRRASFRDFNIHIKNNSTSYQSSSFDLTDQKTEQRLDNIVDLHYPRDAHGNAPLHLILFLPHLILSFKL